MTTLVNVGEKYTRYLVGRGIGAKIRDDFFAGSPETWPTVIDFSAVEQATESCMDEMLGVLARRWGRASLDGLAFEGCNRSVRDTLTWVIHLIESPPPPPTPESVAKFLKQPVIRPRAANGTAAPPRKIAKKK
jgi:hypothetical protein